MVNVKVADKYVDLGSIPVGSGFVLDSKNYGTIHGIVCSVIGGETTNVRAVLYHGGDDVKGLCDIFSYKTQVKPVDVSITFKD